MGRKYYLDGHEIPWQKLIDEARKEGYWSSDHYYCTSEAAEYLKRRGHDVECTEVI